jgi:hypothetical protein
MVSMLCLGRLRFERQAGLGEAAGEKSLGRTPLNVLNQANPLPQPNPH